METDPGVETPVCTGETHLRGLGNGAVREGGDCKSRSGFQSWTTGVIAGVGVSVAIMVSPVLAQRQTPAPPQGPWMDRSLSPDERADLVIAQMTLDEKISLVHGGGMFGFGPPPGRLPPGAF